VLSYHLASVQGTDDGGNTDTGITGMKAVDDLTLEVTLKYPYADFEYVVAHPALAPVPQAFVEGGVDYNGQKIAFGDMPIGNGPFKLSEPWVRPVHQAVQNENCYGDKPYIDGIGSRSSGPEHRHRVRSRQPRLRRSVTANQDAVAVR
jgi:peptide/nickel transport system substrate-binding protein/oligopeptide transport system substrate-binding protein